jgi:hypothetical protein
MNSHTNSLLHRSPMFWIGPLLFGLSGLISMSANDTAFATERLGARGGANVNLMSPLDGDNNQGSQHRHNASTHQFAMKQAEAPKTRSISIAAKPPAWEIVPASFPRRREKACA